MTSPIENRFYKEPTHDEIALSAFLAWERDGRPQNTDMNYWLEAESRLRTQRQKQAQAAAAQAAKPWPPQSGAARAKTVETKKDSVAAARPSLATTVERATGVKVKPATRAAAPRRIKRTPLEVAR